jgi:hypothetical protein
VNKKRKISMSYQTKQQLLSPKAPQVPPSPKTTIGKGKGDICASPFLVYLPNQRGNAKKLTE